jgi:hypothetical protein
MRSFRRSSGVRTLASLCARVSAKQDAGSADLDGPATRVRAPAEQPRGLGDPRCTTLDEGVLERSPLGWPVRGACLHKRSIPGETKSRRARLTANSGEEASRPFRPAAPPTGTSRAIDCPKALETVYGTLPPRTFSHRVAVM